MYINLVFSSGGFKGSSFIGVSQYLEENDLIKHFKRFIGCSIGSIYAFITLLGYTHKEIKEFSLIIIKNLNILDDINPLDLLDNYGMYNQKKIKITLEKILYNKLKVNDISFIDLSKRSGKELIVSTTNITKQQIEYFSLDNTPNMSVIEALLMSSNIPLIFNKINYNNSYYIDGSVMEHCPINYIKQKHPKELKENTLCVELIVNDSKNDTEIKSNTNDEYSIVNYIQDTLACFLKDKNKKKKNNYTIYLDTSIKKYSFKKVLHIDENEYNLFIERGYNETKTFFFKREKQNEII